MKKLIILILVISCLAMFSFAQVNECECEGTGCNPSDNGMRCDGCNYEEVDYNNESEYDTEGLSCIDFIDNDCDGDLDMFDKDCFVGRCPSDCYMGDGDYDTLLYFTNMSNNCFINNSNGELVEILNSYHACTKQAQLDGKPTYYTPVIVLT